MGEFELRGKDAVRLAAYVTSNDVAALASGQVHYSTILNEQGTIEDDCLVYRFGDRVMIVVNAANREKDRALITRHAGAFDCVFEDASDRFALLALQGPAAERILQPVAGADLSVVRYYHFVEGDLAGVPAIISRTGYTGEDGFEIYFAPDGATRVWNAIVGAGVSPAGLGARDTLRLEAGMALYGHEIDDRTTPLEAGLGWVVKLAKDDFVGRAALVAQKSRGVGRKLVGFIASERCVPRQGYPILVDGQPGDTVRSGAMSPTLGVPIGTTYVSATQATEGTSLEIDIRRQRVPARVVRMPFYRGSARR